MTGTALLMMLVYLLIIWGGLVFGIVHLMQHPDETAGHDE